MKLPASSYRALLEGAQSTTSRASAAVSRPIHTSSSALNAENRDSNSPIYRSKQYNEKNKQSRVSDTILTASRLGRHADSISKDTSDQYSGWKRTPGPSTRRNVGRPKLSREASQSMVRAIASDNVETLLGTYSASVLTAPLLTDEGDVEEGFQRAMQAKISARDFIAPRRNIEQGDFVEVRRGTTTAVGIVLPPPEDESPAAQETTATAQRAQTSMKELFILITTGQVVLFKENDVMMQIPQVIEPSLARAAAVQSKLFVVSSNSLDTPSNSDGSHDSHSYNSSGETHPTEGSALQEEPVDEPRFEARASICNKLRILERQKEKELQRILPAFQSLFLVPQQQQQPGQKPGAQRKKEDEENRMRRMDLRTGAITTFEAAKLMHEVQVRRGKGASKKGKNGAREAAPLTACTIYATHSLLMSHPTHFLADALSHRTSQLFMCRSDAERANLQLISKWIAGRPGSQGQAFIDAFCKKASKLREWAENHPHDPAGPPRIIDAPNKDLDLTWTSEDKSIIEFLQASLGSRREVQADTHGSIAMEIVKRAGGHFRVLPYPNVGELLDVDKATELLLVEKKKEGRKLGKSILQTVGTDLSAGPDLQHALVMHFLTSIGALPPWQNPIRLDASFRSATAGEDGGEPEREPNAGEQGSTEEAAKSPAKKFNLTLDHEIEAMRHDFGKRHTVYVIDDEGAFELDDGISIERVHGRETEQAWVHIHIADPTAWIQFDDPLGQRAERRFQTLYFPEARWAMLPDEFVRSGVGLRSTSTGEASAEGQRVMTFSALVDLSTGLVQDIKVRPAFVHDVKTISYNKVSGLLVDPSSASSESGEDAELSLLLQLATRLSENRTRSSAFVAYRSSPSLSISPLPLPGVPVSPSQLQRPYFFAGFPSINLSVATNDNTDTSDSVPALGQFLVSEMMILAGRIAASYGRAHNLSFAYRYQLRPESDKDAEEILSMRTNLPSPSGSTGASASPVNDNGIVGHGLIEYENMLVQGISVSSSGYSASPRDHFSLGITADSAAESASFTPPPAFQDAITSSGYARATSPLRRYPDMLTHWQIKHHLVHQSAKFRKADIERILPQMERQEVTSKQLMRSAGRFWLHSLLQRSLLDAKFKDGRVDGPFTARVMLPQVRVSNATLLGRVRVNVAELGIPADLEWDPSETPPTSGETFKVMPVAVISAGIRSGLVVRRV
ncbi:related to Exoribonuclease II [Ustilago trichophora]|uniref:Related to Exoribonuclease II n=1 Tax=Ustilago trichophora TaxID=86804 RepID=A0A5C3EIJ1_9BASI|nr:related to Exoribonuclease II [Ustilago trichophora]